MHSHDTEAREMCFVNTVEENEKRFTNGEALEAKATRNSSFSMGFPTSEDMKKICSDGFSKENPVTSDAVTRANSAFGKSEHEIKSKAARGKPNEVTVSHCNLPEEMKQKCNDADMAADTFFANDMPMSLTRSNEIKFMTASFMENRSKRVRLELSKMTFDMCKRKGFKIRTLKADGEFQDPETESAKPEADVDVDTAARKEHAGEMECPIGTTKE